MRFTDDRAEAGMLIQSYEHGTRRSMKQDVVVRKS